MPHAHASSSPSDRRSLAPAARWRRALACAGWRLLWAVPALGGLLLMPPSPAKWPALLLLVGAVLVLHADAILRSLCPRLLRSAHEAP